MVSKFRTTQFREFVPGSILDKDVDDGLWNFDGEVWSEELFGQDFSAQNGRHSRPGSFRARRTNRTGFAAARDRIEQYQEQDEHDYKIALLRFKTVALFEPHSARYRALCRRT